MIQMMIQTMIQTIIQMIIQTMIQRKRMVRAFTIAAKRSAESGDGW